MTIGRWNKFEQYINIIFLLFKFKEWMINIFLDAIILERYQRILYVCNVSVNLTYYKAEKWVPKVSWIPNKHYSGVYGLLKLILPDAMREDKVLVFDTDVTVLNDVSLLWQMFEKFTSDQALGLTENQSHWYIKALSYGQRPWPALGRGFNTGVMLMHLQQLRKRKFMSLWETVAKRVLVHIPETSLADQDIINAVVKEHSSIVYKIQCTWNIQLSDHTISDICYRDTSQINVRNALFPWNTFSGLCFLKQFFLNTKRFFLDRTLEFPSQTRCI